MTAKVRDVIKGSMFSFLAVIHEIHIYLKPVFCSVAPRTRSVCEGDGKEAPGKGTSLHGLRLYELSWLGTRNDQRNRNMLAACPTRSTLDLMAPFSTSWQTHTTLE
jgi:hypothetical protein